MIGLYWNVGLFKAYPEYKTLGPLIRFLYTVPEMRGQGIGKLLLQEIERLSFTRGHKKIYLFTNTAESVKKDLKQGWNLTYHLHNHYEPKAINYVGILAPSLADAQFFVFLSEDFALQNALITNGFHTVEIKSQEFSKFKSHGN